MKSKGDLSNLSLKFRSIIEVFKDLEDITAYKNNFTEINDPGFGIANRDGRIQDLLKDDKVALLKRELESDTGSDAVVVFGAGAAVEELNDVYDLIFYFDKTRQPILWEMWDGKLVPFGRNKPDPDYFWKEYYYCDYYLLDHQKEYLLPRMETSTP